MPGESLNDFFEDHIGILTTLGLFMIFLVTASNKILPEIPGISLDSFSSLIWLSSMVIIMVCLVVLIRAGFNHTKLRVKVVALFFLIMLLSLISYSFIVFVNNPVLVSSISNLPKSVYISLSMVFSLLAITALENIIKKNSLRRGTHIVILLAALVFIIYNFSKAIDKLASLDFLFYSSLGIISIYLANYRFFQSRTHNL